MVSKWVQLLAWPYCNLAWILALRLDRGDWQDLVEVGAEILTGACRVMVSNVYRSFGLAGFEIASDVERWNSELSKSALRSRQYKRNMQPVNSPISGYHKIKPNRNVAK